jgi:hypothetical protein
MAETGIQWGTYSGKLHLGLNVRYDDVGPNTFQSHVYVDCYYAANANGYDSNEVLTWGGSVGGSVGYHLYEPYAGSATYLAATYDLGLQNTDPNGGPSWFFSASTSPAYNGDAPTVGYNFSLPARPSSASRPGQVAAPTISSITDSSAYVWWAAPNDNGSPIDDYQVQISNNADFSSIMQQVHTTSAMTFGSLYRASTYWARVVAHNGIDWGDWGPGTAFTTLALAPVAPTNLGSNTVAQDSANVSWDLTDNGGAYVTSWWIQVATDAAFTQNVVNVGGGSLSGLIPGTLYYFRIKGTNSVGSGPWSATSTFTTKFPVAINVGGSWVEKRAYGQSGASFLSALSYKKISGVWRQ